MFGEKRPYVWCHRQNMEIPVGSLAHQKVSIGAKVVPQLKVDFSSKLTTADNVGSFCPMYRFRHRKLWYYSTRAITRKRQKNRRGFEKRKVTYNLY